MGKFKWRTLIGLLLIYATVILYPNYQWLWGILFLYWVIPSFVTNSTYFIEPIHQTENPILFWVITTTWLALGAYILVEPLL